MLIKKLIVDGKEVTFGASARLPRLYRQTFGRDVMLDMASLSESFERVKKAHEVAEFKDLPMIDQLSVLDLTIFENLAYVMAKLASPQTVPGIDEWLDQFQVFDIYQVFPELSELYLKNQQGMSVPKKK